MTVITADWAAIAVQGPKSKELLMTLSGGESITEPMKNALNTLELEGHTVRIAKTGYTGEPIGYESMSPARTLCGCGTAWWNWAPVPPAWVPVTPCVWKQACLSTA